jgi:hypothetical protein
MSLETFDTCLKFNISPNQLYIISCFENKIVPCGTFLKLNDEITMLKYCGLIDDKTNELTSVAHSVLKHFNTLIDGKKSKVEKEVLGEKFLERVNEYRELFPKDKYIHSGQLPRQSTKELTKRFIWFFKEYPEYDWDLVIDATRYYIALHEKTTPKYNFMMTSSYFIKKTDQIGKDIKSKLADFCEQLIENGDDLTL